MPQLCQQHASGGTRAQTRWIQGCFPYHLSRIFLLLADPQLITSSKRVGLGCLVSINQKWPKGSDL